MKFPLTINYPCGEDSVLLNVRDAEDNCLFGEAGALPNHSNNLRANWQELVRRANAYDALVESLRKTLTWTETYARVSNIDVATSPGPLAADIDEARTVIEKISGTSLPVSA